MEENPFVFSVNIILQTWNNIPFIVFNFFKKLVKCLVTFYRKIIWKHWGCTVVQNRTCACNGGGREWGGREAKNQSWTAYVWKVSKYRFIFRPYFPLFQPYTEIYGINLRIQSKYKKIRTRNNSVFEHFSRSAYFIEEFSLQH